jgi:hypothetical protein
MQLSVASFRRGVKDDLTRPFVPRRSRRIAGPELGHLPRQIHPELSCAKRFLRRRSHYDSAWIAFAVGLAGHEPPGSSRRLAPFPDAARNHRGFAHPVRTDA